MGKIYTHGYVFGHGRRFVLMWLCNRERGQRGVGCEIRGASNEMTWVSGAWMVMCLVIDADVVGRQ